MDFCHWINCRLLSTLFTSSEEVVMDGLESIELYDKWITFNKCRGLNKVFPETYIWLCISTGSRTFWKDWNDFEVWPSWKKCVTSKLALGFQKLKPSPQFFSLPMNQDVVLSYCSIVCLHAIMFSVMMTVNQTSETSTKLSSKCFL